MSWAWLAALATIGAAAALWQRAHAARRFGRLRERFEDARDKLERLQHAFQRFAPRDVVENLAAGDEPRADRREVTVLFADLVGFTRLSEHTEPGALVRILNGYHARMQRVIAEHRGHVALLIGDGILALFGAFDHNPWQSDDAARAALAMRAELVAYNEELGGEQQAALSLGIGVHRGIVVAGLVGSSELQQWTAVGRTVNLAARVQDLTRDLGVDVLLTEGVRRALDPRFRLRAMPARTVRGIAEPVATYALEGIAER
jgi:adenylate cyclase